MRILIVSPRRLTAETLAVSLGYARPEAQFTPVRRIEDAASLAASAKVGAIVIDLDHDERGESLASPDIGAVLCGVPLVLISGTPRQRQLEEAARLRAAALISKNISVERLGAVISMASRGASMLDDSSLIDLTTDKCPLNGRELRVLDRIYKGQSTGDIASEFYLAPGTVRNLVSSAIRKLGARDRLSAVRLAATEGWILPVLASGGRIIPEGM